VQSLHSEILRQDFELYIKLPWSYERGDAVYPVLFILDANRSFPLYSTMSLIYETPGTGGEEIIIVGIGYKVDEDRMLGLVQWAAWRTRDLTPEHDEETEQFWKEKLSALLGREYQDVHSGGAAHFLKSLREEIIPFIESNYRVSSDRGLAGYSYGGLLTLYALFHAPELFKRYFAGGPTMWEQLFEYEEQYASAHNDLTAKVFITAGGQESDLHEPIQRMVDRLRSRGYPGLEVQTHVFEGEGHSSAYAASVGRALRVLYMYRED
jgi:predicted alpha/beta superfamily hydrolase